MPAAAHNGEEGKVMRKRRGSVMPMFKSATDELQYSIGGLCSGHEDSRSGMYTIEHAIEIVRSDPKLLGFTFRGGKHSNKEVRCHFKRHGAGPNTDPEWSRYTREDFFGEWSCSDLFTGPGGFEHRSHHLSIYQGGLIAIHNDIDKSIIWRTSTVPPVGSSTEGVLQGPPNECGEATWVPCIVHAVSNNTLHLDITDSSKSCTFRREYRPPLSRYKTHEIKRTMCQQVLGETRRSRNGEESEFPYNVVDNVLYFIHPRSAFRMSLIHVIDNVWFDRGVLLLIILNGFALVLDDPLFNDVDWLQEVTSVSEITFQALFTIEMVLKILALGFVMHPGSYLRSDPVPFWNRLDFLIVLSGYAALAAGSGNFTALRLLRCLRPLRTMNRVKELRQLMATLASALPLAIDIFLLFFLLMWVFAILGIQLFSGDFHQRCYLDPPWEGTVNATFFSTQGDSETTYDVTGDYNSRPWLVFNDTETCGSGRSCSTNGLGVRQSCIIREGTYKREVLNFDNIFSSLLLTFKLMSLDDWPDDMKDVQDANGHIAWIYFFLCTLLGNVFAVNLILAMLSSVYSHERDNKMVTAKPVLERLSPATFIAASAAHPLLVVAMPIMVEEAAAEEDLDEGEYGVDGDEFEGDEWIKSPDLKASEASLSPLSGGKLESPVQSTKPSSESDEKNSTGTQSEGSQFFSPRMMENNLGVSRRSDGAPDGLDMSQLQTSIDDLSALQEADDAIQEIQSSMYDDAPVDLPGSPGARKLLLNRERIRRLRKVGYYEEGTLGNTLFKLSKHKAFNILVVMVTIINIIALGTDHYTIGSTWLDTIYWINYVSTFIFIIEAIIKMVGMTPELYFSDNYNTFDFLLVLVSIPEIITHPSPTGGGSGASALRGFRLARVFRLAKKWRGLNIILKQISNAVIDVGYLSIIVMLFLFIYSVMGVQLFACKDDNGRCGFENLGASTLTVFVVVTGESWAQIMKETVQRTGAAAIAYFVTLFLLGNYILLNLFIAILIDNFAGEDEVQGGEGIWDCCRPKKIVAESNNRGENGIQPGVHQHEPIYDAAKDNVTDRDQDTQQKAKTTDGEVVAIPQVRSDPDFCLEIESATDEEHNKSGKQTLRPAASSATLDIEPDLDVLKLPDTVSSPGDVTLPFSYKNGFLGADRRSSAFEDEKHLFAVSMQMGSAGSSFCTKKRRERRLSVWSMSGLTKASVQVQKKAKTIVGRSTLFPPGEEHGKIVEIPPQPFENLKFAEFNKKVGNLDSILARFSSPGEDTDPDCCCAAPNILRQYALKVVTWTYFDLMVLVVIVINLIFIAVDNPSVEDNQPGLYRVLRVGDFVFVSLFSLEMVTKILAWGWCGFFNDKWNVIDAVVVVTSVIGLFVPTLRSFRSLRILRLVTSGSPEMKVVLTAVMSAMPSIQNVIFVSTMVWFIFAIVGVSLFKGALYECSNPAIRTEEACNGTYMMEVREAFGVSYVQAEASWGPIWFTFDDVFESMFTLFQISVGEKWREMMYRTMDAPGPGRGPWKNGNQTSAVFFVAFVVVGQFFLVNLFIGVLIHSFAEMKGCDRKLFMTDNQYEWARAQKVILHTKLQRNYTKHRTWMGANFPLIHDVVMSPHFETGITGVIVLNSITLALQHYHQPTGMTDFLYISNWIFILIFAAEAAFKISIFSMHYFSEGWNRFDFLIVVASVVGLALSSTASSTSGIRVLRVGRMLRLFKRAKTLQKVLRTIINALPSLINIAGLLFVVFFIFGVFGVDLFGRIAISKDFNRWSNFDNLYKALVTLYQVSTTEGWNDMMVGTTEDVVGCTDDCGVSTGVARAYFVLFLLLGCFIFLNLFVYVLIEHFEDEKRARGLQESTRDLEAFDILKEEWIKEDPGGTGLASADALIRILQKLPEPLWLSSPFSMSALMGMGRSSDFLCTQKQLRSMLIPLDKHMRVRYMDVVMTLSLKVFSIDIRQAIQSLASGEKFDPSFWSVHHYHAVQYVIHNWMMMKMESNYVKYEQKRCATRKAIRLIRQRITEATTERDRLATAKQNWVSDIITAYTKPAPQSTNNSMNNTFLDSEDVLTEDSLRGGGSLSVSLRVLNAVELEKRPSIFKPSRPPSITLMLPSGCYSGETKKGKPHGHGILIYPSQTGYYEGSWSAGQRHGSGLEIRLNFACKGEWMNGKLHGPAAYGYADEGWVFKGNFCGGVPMGHGKLFYFEGTKVEGQFNSSFCPEGLVELMGPDGIHHQAPIENYGKTKKESYILLEGKRDEQGRPTDNIQCMTCNGNIYELRTKEGQLSGKGSAIINSLTPTERWVGDFVEGIMVQGTRTVEGCSITEQGVFTHNVKRLAEGTMSLPEAKVRLTGSYTWSDTGVTLEGEDCHTVMYTDESLTKENIRWRGEFKDWMLNGKGTKDYIGGSTLTGSFSDGELRGFSMIKYQTGVICNGHFVNTLAHGWAKVTFPNIPEYTEQTDDEGEEGEAKVSRRIPIDSLQLRSPNTISSATQVAFSSNSHGLKYLLDVPRPAQYANFHKSLQAQPITASNLTAFPHPPSNPLIGVFHKGLLWTGPTVNGNVPHGYGSAYLQSGMYFEGIAYGGRIQAGVLFTPDGEKLEGTLKFGCLLQNPKGGETRLF
eukprot:TRINITY_DN1216_c1_g1_i2.p1 TRINITY_DN1216_c1_g1~~TRINITY_DN1216_c1_g1_i2.p1  ORF type:complete len:2604 (+),score=664.54 TRINITY_DN1216_c1_g1_i2:280-8091(+)